MSKRKIDSNLKRSMARISVNMVKRNARKTLQRGRALSLIAQANSCDSLIDERLWKHGSNRVRQYCLRKGMTMLFASLSSLVTLGATLGATPVAVAVKKPRKRPAPRAVAAASEATASAKPRSRARKSAVVVVE